MPASAHADSVTLRLGVIPGGPFPEPRKGEPVTCGVPWPRGVLAEGNPLELLDAGGDSVPFQARVLDRWPDGSVRWLLLDWLADTPADGEGIYRLVRSTTESTAPQSGKDPPLSAAALPGGIEIDTGAARFRLTQDALFSAVEVGGVSALDAGRSGFRGEGERGEAYRPHLGRLWLDETGPVRAKVCAEGELRDESGGHFLDLFLELDFFAGSGAVRVLCTLRNHRAAGHPGGHWSLGSAGSVYLRDFALTLAVPAATAGRVFCSAERGRPPLELAQPFELYQDSSGGENWRSTNHVNRHHQVPTTFRGYRLRHPGGEAAGLRATPAVVLRGGPAEVAIAVPAFWENFPMAVEAAGGALVLRLFPRQFADTHELQGGEQKTHAFYVCFGPGHVGGPLPLDWCRTPSVARAEPAWYVRSGAVPFLAARDEDTDPGYARLVGSALDGENTFEHKREVIDEYGWRHFGEIYGDHEAVFHKGDAPLVSHFNNQYDAVAGFAMQFFRTGDARWWKHFLELARHVLDVDIYHTDQDKSAYNGGLFWHTVHYVDAGAATHRTYPRAAGVPGGGPANEQNYATGLMLHHFLTGDRASRQTAIGLARWVIDMDDGRKTPFRWLAGGATGLASCSRTPSYHGPGRGSGNSLAALLDGHRLTDEAAFLEKAEELIRRVIHPADDVPARNLLDAENRWFYTMFLQSLGKYLHHKAELGQFDAAYTYGRASLLHYARWMADHEYPFLQKPEILEYPTETWAAQDMRKSEVFWHAWLHAPDAERERFRERARFFFADSVRTLEGMPTRHLCRPVVLLLSHGLRQGWFERNPEARAPGPGTMTTGFGRPAAFEPQKPRALRRLGRLAACVAALGVAGCAVLAWWFWG